MSGMIIFIIILVAYFGPLFLVPMVLKSSNNVMGQLGKGLAKVGDSLNKRGQTWMDERKARNPWRQDREARKKAADQAATEKWARGLRSYKDTPLGRLRERTNMNRIRKGGLVRSRFGTRESFAGTIVGDTAEEAEFEEDVKQLDMIDRGLGKPAIEANYKARLAAGVGSTVEATDTYGQAHRLKITEGMHRRDLATAARFLDQSSVHSFIESNGDYGDQVLRKAAEKDFNTYANLDPDHVFTPGRGLPSAFVPTDPNDKDGLKNLRIGAVNFSAYDDNHRKAVLDGITVAAGHSPQIAQDYTNMLIRSQDVNQAQLTEITTALGMNPDHIASIRASGGAQRAELLSGAWVRVNSATGRVIP